MNKVALKEFAGGALQENFQKVFEQVVQNMQDPNTPWKNKRSIIIKVSFTQNEDRDDSRCEISVERKLSSSKPIETKFAIGKDLETGEVFAEEYGKQVRGQMCIDDIKEDKPEDANELNDNVIDLRAKRQAQGE